VIDLAHRFGSAAVAKGVEKTVDLQALMVSDGLRLRTGCADRSTDAEGALSRIAARV